MFINDVHIIWYFLIGILGLAVGQFLDWVNIRLADHKKVFCKELIKEYLPNMKINLKTMYSTSIIYILILYCTGISVNLLEYLILAPMFISAFVIDYKKQIIPNRLTLSILEVAIIFAFISGFSSMSYFLDKIYGMLAGGGIFLVITLIGGLIAGKEAMGFGDVKLMGALGLIFGLVNIVTLAVIAFLLAAIISIFLIATKKKKSSEYIPFGPFIIIAAFIVMLVPHGWLLLGLLKIFSLGMYKTA